MGVSLHAPSAWPGEDWLPVRGSGSDRPISATSLLCDSVPGMSGIRGRWEAAAVVSVAIVSLPQLRSGALQAGVERERAHCSRVEAKARVAGGLPPAHPTPTPDHAWAVTARPAGGGLAAHRSLLPCRAESSLGPGEGRKEGPAFHPFPLSQPWVDPQRDSEGPQGVRGQAAGNKPSHNEVCPGPPAARLDFMVPKEPPGTHAHLQVSSAPDAVRSGLWLWNTASAGSRPRPVLSLPRPRPQPPASPTWTPHLPGRPAPPVAPLLPSSWRHLSRTQIRGPTAVSGALGSCLDTVFTGDPFP